MQEIVLGRNIFDRSKYAAINKEGHRWGSYLVCAPTRYGKSIVSETMTMQESRDWGSVEGENRFVLIFDYAGEHGNMKYGNPYSENSMYLNMESWSYAMGKEKCELYEFKFKLSQFNNVSDWIVPGFEFPEGGSKVMAMVAGQQKWHNDNLKLVLKMFEDLYSKGGGITCDTQGIMRKYPGLILPAVVFRSSVQAIYARLETLHRAGFFASSHDQEIHFGERCEKLVKRKPIKSLHVNMNLQEAEQDFAQMMAGKMIEQIYPLIINDILKPFIVVEEADKLIPAWVEAGLQSKSRYFFIELLRKAARHDVSLLFITQEPQMLPPEVYNNCMYKIFGANTGITSEEREVTSKLKWDHGKNYREFALFETGKPRYQVFVPFEASTRYWGPYVTDESGLTATRTKTEEKYI